MKKFSLILLMAALALPVMAQMTASKAESMRSQDRDQMEVFAPVKAFDASAITAAEKTRGGYLWDFETDESLAGWMTYDADGDGYGWEIDSYYSYNGGTYSLTSRSYYSGALDPDNWLISPTVTLDGELVIHAENYMSSWQDKFMVYVFVGEFTDVADLDNFVPISEFITPPAYEWGEYTFDLSAYEGATGCFAIRHYDCYDMYRVMVDYITLGYTPDPVATTPEELAVEPGANDASVIWTDTDDTNWNLRYRVYTEPTGFFWDFEDCDSSLPEGFTTLDADGDGYDWMLWDPISLGYDPGDGERLNGTKCAASASYQGVPLYPDNWLITPQVPLTGELSFYAAGQDPSYAAEVFAVYVCTGDPTDINNFVKISDDITATTPIQQYTFDLSEYEGQMGYIAFRHYNVTDMFRLNIDDILIGTPTEEAEWIYVNGITDPNYIIEGLDPETTYEVQVQAYNEFNESDWSESTIFTTLEGGETPVDPHMTGYWVVTILADGTEEFLELQEGTNGDFVNLVDVIYPTYEHTGNFYFMINGVAYGAEADATLAVLGDADQNPLTEGTNTYYVDNGYSYVLGIHFIMDENTGDLVGYSAYVARGGAVDVNEMNAGKTVASERYFNVAGQEMAQPNGVTIKVITYTDGTTNIVKVVK